MVMTREVKAGLWFESTPKGFFICASIYTKTAFLLSPLYKMGIDYTKKPKKVQIITLFPKIIV